MCGRTCLTLDPDCIVHACKYTASNSNSSNDEDKLFREPEWRSEFNCGKKFQPSHNIAPTDMTPVIVSGEHFRSTDEGDCPERVIVPMMWGMIPFWHKGDYRKHGLTTNNCRLEHMLESKLYRGPFQKGQRCVILCEGFYEWQTTKTAKPSMREAYYLYMPQVDGIKIYDNKTWSSDNVNLMKLAGLFDIWEDENGDKIFSYSVITFESTKLMSWLHHRMPAILETEEQVNDWLNFKETSEKQALAALRPATKLEWHQVSNLVNNSRNKSENCNKPIDLCPKKEIPTNNLTKWLVRRKREEEIKAEIEKDTETEEHETPSKRMRIKRKVSDDESSCVEK
ncbi:abasic site processing protein HMCES [Episyrphus balteatus]|uniref:abasic site processing protein HMCES n=1 Tax=Episyrphus balteatus TaxID=286459 RepID=UPI002484ECEA|nr:abasic site processing protein HMCES [Episyrphus balteatus]